MNAPHARVGFEHAQQNLSKYDSRRTGHGDRQVHRRLLIGHKEIVVGAPVYGPYSRPSLNSRTRAKIASTLVSWRDRSNVPASFSGLSSFAISGSAVTRSRNTRSFCQ